MRNNIDLRRVTSPLISGIDNDVSETLRTMAANWHPSDEMRQHRKFGTARDREAAASFLSERYGKPIDPSRIFLANGTQNVLFVLLSALGGRGSTILAEEMTYRQIREVTEILGLNLVGVALDRDGIIPQALDEACKKYAPKVLYCIPTMQNPTATIMSKERRLAIASVARKHGVTIIEDEAQGLIPANAPRPLSAIAPDITWTVTGLSKCTLVGLRIAYVVAPDAATLSRVMTPFETMALWYASTVSAAFITQYIESGFAKTMLRAIQLAATRRQSLAASILPKTMITGGQGLHVWLIHPEKTGDELVEVAMRSGVFVRSGSEYRIDAKPDSLGIRISLADVFESDLSEALRRLALAITP